MIKINKDNDITLLTASVTDFADSLRYCEYKIPLSIKGIKPKPSEALIQGTKAHHAEEKYEQEHVDLEPVSIEQIEDKEENIENITRIFVLKYVVKSTGIDSFVAGSDLFVVQNFC